MQAVEIKPVAAYLPRVDPRARILTAVAFSVLVALADQTLVLELALAAVVVALVPSGLSMRSVLRRLVPLNLLMLLLLVLLPLSGGETSVVRLGPLGFSREGLLLGAKVALKGNTIVLALLVLVGSMEATTLGHALSHLRMPNKLTHLLLFTVRYLDVLQREYARLRAAMKIRAFRPRMGRHTYRAYGYLVGMLLVGSFDRSERILAAMKCRGFHGRFYLLDHFAFSRRDLPFCVASLGLLLLLALMEWT